MLRDRMPRTGRINAELSGSGRAPWRKSRSLAERPRCRGVTDAMAQPLFALERSFGIIARHIAQIVLTAANPPFRDLHLVEDVPPQ